MRVTIVADDKAELQSVIDYGPAVIDGGGLSYLITSTLAGVSNIEIKNCTLIPSTHAAHPIINFVNKTNWQLRQVWFRSDYTTDLNYASSWYGAVKFCNSTADPLENMAIEDSRSQTFLTIMGCMARLPVLVRSTIFGSAAIGS